MPLSTKNYAIVRMPSRFSSPSAKNTKTKKKNKIKIKEEILKTRKKKQQFIRIIQMDPINKVLKTYTNTHTHAYNQSYTKMYRRRSRNDEHAKTEK